MLTAFTSYDRLCRYYKNESPYRVQEHLRDRAFTDQELRQLFSLYQPFDKWAILFGLMLETGMRRIDAVNVHIENLDLSRQQILFKAFKPRRRLLSGVWMREYKSRLMPLSEQLCANLAHYIECNRHSFRHGFIFPGKKQEAIHMAEATINWEFKKHIRPRLKGRFLERDQNNWHLLGPKSFRITLTTRLTDKLPIAKVSKIMGHTRPDTTLRYVAPVKDEVVKENVESCVGQIINNSRFIPKNQTTLI